MNDCTCQCHIDEHTIPSECCWEFHVDQLHRDRDILLLQVSEANEKGYQRAWKEIREQREGLKARCVEKCSHPADFVCDYEDGTSHCLHCLMDKVWEEEAKAADKPEEGCAHRIVVEVPLPEWKKDHIRAVDEQGREKRKGHCLKCGVELHSAYAYCNPCGKGQNG